MSESRGGENNMKDVVWRSCSALALGVLSAQSALAQTTEGAPTSESGAALGEIIVTAERRPEDLQNTPISVLAYSGQALERVGIDSIDDVAGVVPSLSIGGSNPNGGGAPDFAIRGVGQTSARPFSEKGVGLYIDDVYYPRATGSFLNLADVQRIEVLRGPQGTLFGRNTTGGAIRYFTNKPVHDFEAQLSATTGSFERRDFNALVNVPLGDVAALRVQAGSFYREGYVDIFGGAGYSGLERAYGDQEDYAARASLLFEPSSNFSLRLTGGYSSMHSTGDPMVIKEVGFTQPPGPVPGVFPIITAYNLHLATLGPVMGPDGQMYSGPVTGTNDPRWLSPDNETVADTCILDDVPRASLNYEDGNPLRLSSALAEGDQCRETKDDEQVFISADAEWRIGEGLTLRSISGYNKGSNVDQGDYVLFGGSTNAIFNDTESFSQEFQFLGDTERFDWVTGVYYFHETPFESHYNRQLVIFPFTAPPAAVPANLGGPQPAGSWTPAPLGSCCTGFERLVGIETDSYAVFGQGTFDITDKLAFTAGVRYTYDEKSIEVTRTGIYLPNIPAGQRFLTDKDSWEAVDWRATVQYDWTDDLMTYVTASRGFKSGGFNGEISVLQPGPSYEIEPFDPEFVMSYEAGIRSEWFNNRFRANLTGFTMDLDSTVIQIADFSAGALVLRSLNAGYIDLRGVEGEFELAATQELTFRANFGYTDLEYEGLRNGSPLLYGPDADHPTCPAQSNLRTFALCAAQPLTRTPEWTYGVGADWTHLMAGGSLNANVYYYFQDDIFSNNSTQNSIVLDAYGVTNVRLEYDSLETWKVALFGTNVFDEEYYTSGFRGIFTNSTLPVQARSPGRPAEWGLKVSLRY
jgi:iron complex outermembrane receptor protein